MTPPQPARRTNAPPGAVSCPRSVSHQSTGGRNHCQSAPPTPFDFMQFGPIDIQPANDAPGTTERSRFNLQRSMFNARERRRVSTWFALLSFWWLALFALSPAQGAGGSDFFNTSNLPAGDGAPTTLGAKRARC